MIFNVILYKNLRFIRIYNLDLRQYRIKFSLFTCRNPDFLHFHDVVFLSALIGLWKRFVSFRMQHKRAHERLEL